jgi:hypothetical protein
LALVNNAQRVALTEQNIKAWKFAFQMEVPKACTKETDI